MKFAASLLIEMGSKMPKVYFVGSNTTLLNGTCILMDFLSGKFFELPGISDCLPLIRGFESKM